MKKSSISAVMLAMLMTACSNNENLIQTNEDGIQTISAEIIQPANTNSSRVIIGGNPGDGTRPITWRADDPNTKANEADVIYVYDSKGNAGRFIYNETADGSEGVFKRDTKVGNPLYDIKNALCVTTSVGVPSQLPANLNSEFSMKSTMMYHRGAENAPMYGTLEQDGILRFHPVTGIVELCIENLNEYRSENSQMLGIQIQAFDKDGNAKYISANQAKLTNTDNPQNAQIEFIGNGNDFIGLFLQAGTSVDNKLYFPLITGEYGRLEVTIWKNTLFNEKKGKKLSKTVSITPKTGSTSFTIEKKLYSITKTIEKLPEEPKPAK